MHSVSGTFFSIFSASISLASFTCCLHFFYLSLLVSFSRGVDLACDRQWVISFVNRFHYHMPFYSRFGTQITKHTIPAAGGLINRANYYLRFHLFVPQISSTSGALNANRFAYHAACCVACEHYKIVTLRFLS